jgi:hypothetical protein
MTSAKTSKNNNLPGMMNKIESKIENITPTTMLFFTKNEITTLR